MVKRNRWHTEWVAEAVDEHGDIIEPIYGPSEAFVRGFVSFGGDEVYWDIAKHRVFGNDADGVIEREYEYIERIYADGRVVRLATEGGLHPVEATHA